MNEDNRSTPEELKGFVPRPASPHLRAKVLAAAAADAKRRVHIVEFCHQPIDHPVLITMPESEYLRGYVLRVE